jgi:hypothetical protein
MIDGSVPSCTTCSLQLLDSVRLGTVNDSEIPQRVPKYILRDSRGTHYLVFDGWGNKPILRYDSLGRFIGKLGAFGQGPGEYQMTSGVMLGPGDSVFVSARTPQVFAADGSFGRAFPGDVRTLLGPVPDGSGDVYSFMNAPPMAMSNIPATFAARFGTAPHVFRSAPDGSIRDSFPIFSMRAGGHGSRSGWLEWRLDSRPALAPDGTIWTALNFRFEQHAADGTRKRLIGMALPGARPIMTEAEADSLMRIARAASQPPTPVTERVRAGTLQVDERGLLWIVRAERAPGADTIKVVMDYLSPDEAPMEGTVQANIQDRLFHTIVDVIDPARGELIARTTLPFNGLVVRPGFVGRLRADELDRYIVDVYRLALRN